MNRTDERPGPADRRHYWLRARPFGLAARDRSRSYVGPGHRLLTEARPAPQTMEYALPLSGLGAALRSLRALNRSRDGVPPHTVTVRFGAAEPFLLSPAAGRATGYLDLSGPRNSAFAAFLCTAEEILREHDGRPHWGRAHTATPELLAARYPGWAEFHALRAALDPSGALLNDHLRRTLVASR
jgi:FAD/FMN-containing dehydrogenase